MNRIHVRTLWAGLFLLSIATAPLSHPPARAAALHSSRGADNYRVSNSTSYTITDLGPMAPYAVNNQRQVVGEGTQGTAVLWQSGQLYNFGALGGDWARFTDINENHQVTGVVHPAQGEDIAFRWTDANTNLQVDPGELQWLGNLGGWTHAEAINNLGHIAGTAHDGDYTRAFIWGGSTLVDLGTLGGPVALAYDLNDQGAVVGTSCEDDGDGYCADTYHAVQWAGGSAASVGVDAGGASATSINNLGQIVGYRDSCYCLDNVRTIFAWSPEAANGLGAGVTDLYQPTTTLPEARINDLGEILIADRLWQNGATTLLADLLPSGSGWTMLNGRALNDQGDIVGEGWKDGQWRGFLLSPVRWTIMHYMAADNNLGETYPRVFNHLETLANTPGVNLLVLWDNQADGDSAYYHLQHDTDPTFIADYTEGVNHWPQGELDTGSPLSLSDFVTWGVQNYPAEHYALILDDHGSGLGGGLCDDSGGPGCAAVMSLAEMKLALATSYDQTGEKLDVLYMAMCLMGMIEDAYQFRDHTDFYVANQSIQFAYTRYLTGLDAGLTPAQLAAHLASNYAAERTAANGDFTISVVDMTQLPPLVAAVDQLAEALLAEIDEVAPTLFSLGSLVQRYDNKPPDGITPADTYADLSDLASLIAQNLSGYPGIATAALAVVDAVDAAVMYEAHASSPATDLDNSHGLSIFFPANPSSFYYGENNDFAAGTDWGTTAVDAWSGSGSAWGPLLVATIARANPTGPDDATPPAPVPKALDLTALFLPMIVR